MKQSSSHSPGLGYSSDVGVVLALSAIRLGDFWIATAYNNFPSIAPFLSILIILKLQAGQITIHYGAAEGRA